MENVKQIVKPGNIKNRLKDIERMEQESGFWNDIKKASKVSQEKTKKEKILQGYRDARNLLSDADELFNMAKSEKDDETLEMLYEESNELEQHITSLEVQMMLSGEHDGNNAIISIHPGAGGTESQDWASMLYRMYLRWAERKGFKVEELDYQVGDELD